MQIIWLPQAVANLKEIRGFIAKDSPNSASKVAKSIKETVNLLKDNPHLGKPSLVGGFREKQVVGLPFVIPYKVVDSKIIIIRVFHNNRKPIT